MKPFLIGIAGGSASGKTSVSQIVFDRLGMKKGSTCVYITLDSYYKNPSEEDRVNLSSYNFDHPNALDFDLAYKHLTELISGNEVVVPEYDFTVSRRKDNGGTVVKPSKLIIFEGILAFHDNRINQLMNMKIFVDTADDIRLLRRIYRDIKERGRELNGIIERYNKFVKPCFEDFIKPTRKLADVIVPRGSSNTIAIGLIIHNLQHEINLRGNDEKEEEKLTDDGISPIVARMNIVDSKSNFLDGRLVVNKEEEKIVTLKRILSDLIQQSRPEYAKIMVKFLTDELLRLHTKEFTLFNNITNYIFVENEKINLNILDESKVVVCFYPSLLVREDFNKLKEQIFNENALALLKNKVLYILSHFSSLEVVDSILEITAKHSLNAQVTTLYYSNDLIFYSKLLQNGISNENISIVSTDLILNTENYCDYFKSIVRRYFN